MALVDDQQVVFREVIDHRPGRRSRRALIEVARVVLDAAGEAHLAQHFQIVARALLDALRFERFAFAS